MTVSFTLQLTLQIVNTAGVLIKKGTNFNVINVVLHIIENI